MSGDLLIDLRRLLPLRRRLSLLANLRLERLYDALGSEAESQTRRRISEEKTDPEGKPWAPWSKSYEAVRPARGGMLELNGDLLESIAFEVNGDSITVGSNMVYALVHQEGSVYGPLKKGQGRTPARPYLGVSDENLDDLGQLVIDFVAREFKR